MISAVSAEDRRGPQPMRQPTSPALLPKISTWTVPFAIPFLLMV